jgi:hypothetical protein
MGAVSDNNMSNPYPRTVLGFSDHGDSPEFSNLNGGRLRQADPTLGTNFFGGGLYMRTQVPT